MAIHDIKQIWFNREIGQRLEEVLRGIASSHLNMVENGMRFQDLKQDKKTLRFSNGIVIESSICFGKQTARVYVPIVHPTAKKIADEDPFILIITREWDDAPLTPENIDMMPEGGASGVIEIDTKEGDTALYFWGDRDEYFGTWLTGEGTKTYIANTVRGPNGWVLLDNPTWLVKYNYTNNTWLLNIPKEFESPSGEYYIRAKFAEKTIATEYPRRYANSDLPGAPQAEAVEPGTYRMTIPYYEREDSWEFVAAESLGVEVYPNSRYLLYHGAEAPYVRKKTNVRTTVPVAVTSKFTHTFAGSNPDADADIVNPYHGGTYATESLTLPYIFNVPTTEENPAYIGLHNCGSGVSKCEPSVWTGEDWDYWGTATSSIWGPIPASSFIIGPRYMAGPHTWFNMTISLNSGASASSVPWYGGTSKSSFQTGTVLEQGWSYPENWNNPTIREDGTPQYNLLEVEGYVSVTRSEVTLNISVDDRNVIHSFGVPGDLEPAGVTGTGVYSTYDVKFSGVFVLEVTYSGNPYWT